MAACPPAAGDSIAFRALNQHERIWPAKARAPGLTDQPGTGRSARRAEASGYCRASAATADYAARDCDSGLRSAMARSPGRVAAGRPTARARWCARPRAGAGWFHSALTHDVRSCFFVVTQGGHDDNGSPNPLSKKADSRPHPPRRARSIGRDGSLHSARITPPGASTCSSTTWINRACGPPTSAPGPLHTTPR